ncbi:MAG: hypothetical protein ACREF4_06055 [Gammaproteobacteria bacterium]
MSIVNFFQMVCSDSAKADLYGDPKSRKKLIDGSQHLTGAEKAVLITNDSFLMWVAMNIEFAARGGYRAPGEFGGPPGEFGGPPGPRKS